MNDKKTTLVQMEHQLYDRDKWAWAIYTALRHAPDKAKKKQLWAMLTNDQQEALKIMARHTPGNPPRRAAQPPAP